MSSKNKNFENLKDTPRYSQTSAGIVFDSKPDKEFQEVENKLMGMKRVLEGFEDR